MNFRRLFCTEINLSVSVLSQLAVCVLKILYFDSFSRIALFQEKLGEEFTPLRGPDGLSLYHKATKSKL